MELDKEFSPQLPILTNGGLGLSFSNGELHYTDSATKDESSFRIHLVKYRLEQKENEKGIYIIISCKLLGTNDELIYFDNGVIGEREFNFSDKINHAEVQEYLAERYCVSPRIIAPED